jgi:integrase
MASIRKHRNRWQVQVRRLGSRSISKSFLNRKDAEAWARHCEVQIDQKNLPQDPRQLQRFTLGELVIRYRDTVTPHKRAANVEIIVLNAFLRHPICSKKLSDLTPQDFCDYRDERLKEVKANSLKRMLSPIQNLFEVAKTEWGLPLRDNPISTLKIACLSNRRERRLRDGELDRLIIGARKTKNPIILPIILFALQTGLRRSEILAATWNDLNTVTRALTIPMAKNGYSRTIPLTLAALALLQGLKGKGQTKKMENEKIFPTTANALKLAWDRLIKRTGIEGLHFHDLRHEAISRFFEMGLTMPEVALLSGHRDMRMLFRYSHPQQVRVLQQLDKANLNNELNYEQISSDECENSSN